MLIVIVKRQIPTHLQKIGEKKKRKKKLNLFLFFSRRISVEAWKDMHSE